MACQLSLPSILNSYDLSIISSVFVIPQLLSMQWLWCVMASLGSRWHIMKYLLKKQVQAFLIITTDCFPLQVQERWVCVWQNCLNMIISFWSFIFLLCIRLHFVASLKISTQPHWLLVYFPHSALPFALSFTLLRLFQMNKYCSNCSSLIKLLLLFNSLC